MLRFSNGANLFLKDLYFVNLPSIKRGRGVIDLWVGKVARAAIARWCSGQVDASIPRHELKNWHSQLPFYLLGAKGSRERRKTLGRLTQHSPRFLRMSIVRAPNGRSKLLLLIICLSTPWSVARTTSPAISTSSRFPAVSSRSNDVKLGMHLHRRWPTVDQDNYIKVNHIRTLYFDDTVRLGKAYVA